MASLNSAALVGRLGQDPEIKYLDGGKTIASFRLAVQPYGKDAEVDWFNVTAWGKTAEVLADYAKKGHMLGVSGRLKEERWTDKKTGENRSKVVVVANEVQLLTTKAEAEAMAGGSQAPPPTTTRRQAPAPRQWQEEADGELPF